MGTNGVQTYLERIAIVIVPILSSKGFTNRVKVMILLSNTDGVIGGFTSFGLK